MIVDPKARELIERSKRALRPTESDRQRIEQVLRARLGPDVLPAAESGGASAGLGLKIASSVVVCACVLGTLAFLGMGRGGQSASPREPHVPLVQKVLVPPVMEPPPLAVAPRESVVARPIAARPKQDSLTREVALLSRATSALRAGDASGALRSLDEHQQKYPRGVLREERRAARAQVLCSIGRVSEGRAELDGLSRSPTAARAEQLCSAAASADAKRPPH